MQINFQSSRLLRPARPGFIRLTLVLAFLLNLLPTSYWPFFPEWVMLVVLFWSVRSPHVVGTGTAFLLGILMDVVDGSLMGQHALAYVLVSYAGRILAHRILWLPLKQQVLTIVPILYAGAILEILVRWFAGDEFPGYLYLLQPLITSLLWMPATYVLMLPQFLTQERDYERPI
ncbi:MAG: rod shape-determining protein MreD [Fluviibacter sp.]|jgi:rod shape-determining protein MreD